MSIGDILTWDIFFIICRWYIVRIFFFRVTWKIMYFLEIVIAFVVENRTTYEFSNCGERARSSNNYSPQVYAGIHNKSGVHASIDHF